MAKRRKLLREDWPAADCVLWEDLIRQGGLFEDSGPLSHWRPRSLAGLEGTYGLWLAWIATHDPTAMDLLPHARATPERLLAWIGAMAEMQPITRLNRYLEIGKILGSLEPAWRTDTQRRIERHLRRDVVGHSGPRKNGRILAGEVLFGQFSRELNSLWTKPASREIALDVRDVTLLLFLSLFPLRRRNFAGLVVGQNIFRQVTGWHLSFARQETKTHQPIAASLPAPLCAALTRYFDIYRPLILAPDTPDTGALWIGDRGHPWSAHTLALRVGKLTLERFGIAISPHLFRDSAVTTMILASPDLAALAGALLGHQTAETSRSHYLQARQIEAGRALQSRINQIKRKYR